MSQFYSQKAELLKRSGRGPRPLPRLRCAAADIHRHLTVETANRVQDEAGKRRHSSRRNPTRKRT